MAGRLGSTETCHVKLSKATYEKTLGVYDNIVLAAIVEIFTGILKLCKWGV